MQLALVTPLAVLLSSLALAQKPARTELGVAGLDPVALCLGKEVEGKEALVETWGRFHYRFADAANAKRFRSDPARWGIQWDGACARMGPLSGRGHPGRWTVYKERIYIFASDGCREGFSKAPHRMVPPPEKEPAAPTDAALAKGREWIDKAVAAHGGADAIDRQRALRLFSQGEQRDWSFSKETTVSRAGHVRRHNVWRPLEAGKSGYDTVYVAAGDKAFIVEEGNPVDLLSEESRQDLARYAHREPITLLWARSRSGFEAEFVGEGKLGEAGVVDVRVHVDGLTTTLHLDPESGGILGLSWRGRPADGVTRDVVETFTKWRTVSGVRLPVDRTMVIDGKPKRAISGPWSEATFLQTVPKGMFTKRG